MTKGEARRRPLLVALGVAAMLVGGALAIMAARGDAILLDLAGAVRSALCL